MIEVKRKAKEGETIKITSRFAIGCKEGDTFEVTSEHKTYPHLFVLVRDGRLAVSHDEYIVLENDTQ